VEQAGTLGSNKSGADAGNLAALSIVIAALAVFAYLGVYYNEFLSFDDCDYVLKNPQVKKGITPQSVAWAFTASHASNWHPLTWISHMADWELYGWNAGGHHMTGVAVHALNAVLLFLLMALMTGFTGRSAAVALFFALHPLHVESVAWISERKDVLCAFFWFLALLVYAWYVRKPSVKRFVPVVIAFACSLMSKPMAVTLPFTLLLLDYWPLRRVLARRFRGWKGLIAEKWPLFAMAAASCVVTFYVQRAGTAVATLDAVPLWARVGNAATSYWWYIVKMFWPDHLGAYYYHESRYLYFPLALLLALLLLLVTVVFWMVRRKQPWCLTGWLWYLVTLLPAIGLIQVGTQARADRYTYVPLIGLFIMLVWGAGELVRGRPRFRRIVQAAAVAAVAAMGVKTAAQVGIWQNDVTLFSNVLAIDPRGYFPNLGIAAKLHVQYKSPLARKYFERAKFFKAAGHSGSAYREYCALQESDPPNARQWLDRVVSVSPDRKELYKSLAECSFLSKSPADAERYGRLLLAIVPEDVNARLGLARALVEQNRLPEAELEYRKVLEKDSGNIGAYNMLGIVLAGRGMYDSAGAALRRSLELDPHQARAHVNLGRAFVLAKRFADAAREFSAAMRLDSSNAAIHYDLGTALFGHGDLEAARIHFCRALELDPGNEETKKKLDELDKRPPERP
jgi:tetratricopeptide (TPR) repeat protein